jgi:Bacterial PH domain
MTTTGFVTFLGVRTTRPQRPIRMITATASLPVQPIAGVYPVELREVTVMTVWPSVAKYPLGRALGQAYSIRWPDVYIFRLGNLLALLAIPLSLPLFFLRIAPGLGTRYRLTNRRVIVERGLSSREDKAVDLDRFDRIEVQVQPGQEWYHAGDLIFKQGAVETFRLEGVSRPDTFRATCLKSQLAHAGVQRARQRQRG